MAPFKNPFNLSASKFFEALGRVCYSFWPTVVCAIVAVYGYVISIDGGSEAYETTRVAMAANFGLAATLAWTMFLVGYSVFQRKSKGAGLTLTVHNALQALGFLLPIGFYLLIPEKESGSNDDWIFQRLALLGAAAHLVVAVAPYLFGGSERGFWQWNRTLFLRILTTILYSGVLIAGVELAMLASQYLLNIEWDRAYINVAIFLGVGFSPLFFCAGIPQTPEEILDLEPENNPKPYPIGLKVFTQFVLLPLVALYLVILYAYGARLAIIQAWPVGWVSTLIFSYSVAGILAFLLVWPLYLADLRQQRLAENQKVDEENESTEVVEKPVQQSSWLGRMLPRFFDLALIPLLALEFAAIGIRVQAYGITEERYIGLMMAGWLAFVVAVRLLTKGRLIRFIPASLAVVILWTVFSPWNARETTRASQLNEYTELLSKSKVLKNGKAVPLAKGDTIPERDLGRIGLLTEYMLEKGLDEEIAPMFSNSLSDSLIAASMPIKDDKNGREYRNDYEWREKIQKQIIKEFGLIPEEVSSARSAASSDNFSTPRNKEYADDAPNGSVATEPEFRYAEVKDSTKMIPLYGAKYFIAIEDFADLYIGINLANYQVLKFEGLEGKGELAVDTAGQLTTFYKNQELKGSIEPVVAQMGLKAKSTKIFEPSQAYVPIGERKIPLRDGKGEIHAYFYIQSMKARFSTVKSSGKPGRIVELKGGILFLD